MDLTFVFISLAILIFSVVCHEVAHGFVADKLGDPTARLLGRLTLNPIPHIDPVMSFLLPLLLIFTGSPIVFGAAKPVPVDPFNLRDGRKDMALVSLAGPLTNFLIAAVAALLAKVLYPGLPLDLILRTDLLGLIIGTTISLNLLLGIFNLLPIPPPDGSKIFSLILPEDTARTFLSIGSFGMFIIFALLLFPIGGFSLGSFIGNLMDVLLRLLGI